MSNAPVLLLSLTYTCEYAAEESVPPEPVPLPTGVEVHDTFDAGMCVVPGPAKLAESAFTET